MFGFTFICLDAMRARDLCKGLPVNKLTVHQSRHSYTYITYIVQRLVDQRVYCNLWRSKYCLRANALMLSINIEPGGSQVVYRAKTCHFECIRNGTEDSIIRQQYLYIYILGEVYIRNSKQRFISKKYIYSTLRICLKYIT